MKRGEIWAVSGGADYSGKPRPAIILQSDNFDVTPSITICLLSGTTVENVYARVTLIPSPTNGLKIKSQAMVDKISTIPKSKVGDRIGQLNHEDVSRLNSAVALFLGIADERTGEHR